jgi:hypothetical protein
VTCDKTCLDWSEPDKRGKRTLTGTRRFPLSRLCCALALLRQTPSGHRESTLRLIDAQTTPEHAAAVRSAWSSLASRPAKRTAGGLS